MPGPNLPRMRSACLLVFAVAVVAPVIARAAMTPPFSDELLMRAVQESPPRWKGKPGERYREMKPVMALQLMAVAAHIAPNRKIGDTTLAASLAGKLLSFVHSNG